MSRHQFQNLSRPCLVAIFACSFALLESLGAIAANIYVDGSKAEGTGERESPRKTINSAIAACKEGDSIRVAAGVYPEKVVLLKNGVKLKGGYDSTFKTRDLQKSETVIDGKNKFRPLQVGDDTTEVSKYQIDGFVIRNGLADGTEGMSGKGGGLLIQKTANGKIFDCRFVDNKAMDDGGGIDSEGNGTLKIDRCLFSNNSAADDGGAIRLQNSHSTTTLSNCVFVNNSGLDKYVVQAKGNVKFLNCTFVDNTSADRGLIASRAKAEEPDQVVSITNCIFANNISKRRRPMLFADEGYMPIACSHCLFFQNKADGGLGIQLGSDGNAEGDPGFVDKAKGDFRLKPGSPAIDHGAPLEGIKKDFADQSRSQGAGIDIGALEFKSSPAAIGGAQ